MKAMSAMLISLTITASRVLAAGGVPEGGHSGFMTECLLALFVIIFLFQFVPGITLLVGSVKAMFSSEKEDRQVGSADK